MARALRFDGAAEEREEPYDVAPCETCGSLLHHTAFCRHRDDLAFGTRTPSHNGEYAGPAKVTVLPPGWSHLDSATRGRQKTVLPGQVWANPTGTRYVVRHIVGHVVHLAGMKRGHNAHVSLASMLTKWFYLREAARG